MNSNIKDCLYDFDGNYIRVMSILDELCEFAEKIYGFYLHQSALKFLKPLQLNEGDFYKLKGIYIWWLIFFQTITTNQKTIFQLYVQKKVSKKPTVPKELQLLLTTWKSVKPSFYIISEIKTSDIILLEDCLTNSKILVVTIGLWKIPKENELVTGILLPLGNSNYFSVTDLYVFSEDMKGEIIKYFNRAQLETNTSLFPSILRKSLQMC